MRLGALFIVKVILGLFICLCNGAPPGEDTVIPYTDEEDAFIVGELSNLPDFYIPVKGSIVWKKIAQKISEKWQRRTPGFPKERTIRGLKSHFADVLMHNHQHVNVKVPESLMQRFDNPLSSKKGGGGNKRQYNGEEDKLIVEELLKSPSNKLFFFPTLEAIKAEHDKRRRTGTYGFQFERTLRSIRGRLFVLKHTGQLPDEVMKKFNIDQEGGSSSTSTSNYSRQVTNEGPGQGDWISEMIEELQDNSNCEIDFSQLD